MNRPLVAIAYNPKSGSFCQNRLDRLAQAFDAAGYSSSFVDSYDPDFLSIVQKSSQICVSGGDGTLRDVISRIDGIENLPPISMFPGGTINLIAREAGYPADIDQFVARVTGHGRGGNDARSHYFAKIGKIPMLVCLSAGPDSIAVDGVSLQLKQRIGRFAYAQSFCRLLWSWPRNDMMLESGQGEFPCQAVFILKGRYFAGHWMINPDADLTRDDLEILLLPRARRRDYLRLILSIIVHRSFACKSWQRLRLQSATLTGPEIVPVQVDGDIVANLPITVEVAKNSISFV